MTRPMALGRTPRSLKGQLGHVLLTSSLNSLLVSFLMGSISWTWPAEKPTRRETLSAVAVRWLKS